MQHKELKVVASWPAAARCGAARTAVLTGAASAFHTPFQQRPKYERTCEEGVNHYEEGVDHYEEG